MFRLQDNERIDRGEAMNAGRVAFLPVRRRVAGEREHLRGLAGLWSNVTCVR